MRCIFAYLRRLIDSADIPNDEAVEQWDGAVEWIAELRAWVICARAIKSLACWLGPRLPRVKALIVSGYYRHCYYPGGWLMSIWCWLKHPISKTQRAEAEFSAGWNWPDLDEMAASIG